MGEAPFISNLPALIQILVLFQLSFSCQALPSDSFYNGSQRYLRNANGISEQPSEIAVDESKSQKGLNKFLVAAISASLVVIVSAVVVSIITYYRAFSEESDGATSNTQNFRKDSSGIGNTKTEIPRVSTINLSYDEKCNDHSSHSIESMSKQGRIDNPRRPRQPSFHTIEDGSIYTSSTPVAFKSRKARAGNIELTDISLKIDLDRTQDLTPSVASFLHGSGHAFNELFRGNEKESKHNTKSSTRPGMIPSTIETDGDGSMISVFTTEQFGYTMEADDEIELADCCIAEEREYKDNSLVWSARCDMSYILEDVDLDDYDHDSTTPK